MTTRLICLLAALSAGRVMGLAADGALTETRSAMEQWVETRQLISREKADWEANRETLEQSIQLYERELKSIQAELTKVSTNSTQVDTERMAALGQQKTLNTAQDKIKELVTGYEQRLQKLLPTFPPPLTEKIQPLVARIPANPNDTKLSGAERMQSVVGILNEVDKFNAAVTVVSEIQKNPAGAEVQVETVYLGLGQAYFVDKSGSYAGVGVPGPEGWQWREEKELGASVNKVIAIYKNTQPAVFVGLPVSIK